MQTMTRMTRNFSSMKMMRMVAPVEAYTEGEGEDPMPEMTDVRLETTKILGI